MVEVEGMVDRPYVTFKNKQVRVEQNPRTGKCSKCGFIGQTHIHHDKYHEDDPLKDTRELCESCHKKEHHKDKEFDTPEINYDRIFVNLKEDLMLDLKQMKCKYRMKWNQLFWYLCTSHQKPRNYQKHFETIYKETNTLLLNAKVDKKTFDKFSEINIYFPTQALCIEWLVIREKNKIFGNNPLSI